MHIHNTSKEYRQRRHARVRTQVSGTQERPRLSVFRSNKAMVAQIIDDSKGETLAYVTSKNVAGKTPAEKAHATGKALAEAAKKIKVENVVFDRGGFLFAGKIKAVAEGAREGGLKF